MSTPASAAVAPYEGALAADKSVVTPSAVSGPKASAIFQLGEVLKTVIHRTQTFAGEADMDNAMNVIDSFVHAFVPSHEMMALMTGDQRAAKEDVSLRTPPGGAVANVVTGPVLDYSKLAQAILAEQRKYQAEIPPDKE
jgi:hypothetical protein